MGAPTIPPELRTALERGELIVCLGPGLHGPEQPFDPAQLLLELLAEVDEQALDVDPSVLRDWANQGRAHEGIELLERQLGASFTRLVQRRLSDRGRPIPALARELARLRERLRAVYSSALDRSLERAFEDEWPSFATPRPDVARRRRVIVKLCGTLEYPESWVLTRAALEREFAEGSLRRQVFAAAYRAHCLLFVGFDPTDELFERLSSVSGGAGAQQPTHFLVLPRCDREQRLVLERRGLEVILAEPRAVLRALAGFTDAPARARVELPDCPYPGLEAFDRSLASVFHGRRAEISQAAARLGGPPSRHRRWLSVEGPSGVGKSSFVHAGLVPALGRGYAEGTPARLVIVGVRPGPRPFQALAGALASELGATTPDTPDELAALVRGRAPANAGLLVIVDQLEEAVTVAGPEQRERFALALARLLDARLIYLITTLRADFVTALAAALPELARLLNQEAERYTLAPISRLGLREAIAEPAAQLGVAFEPELVERIASDAEDHLVRVGDHGDVVRTSDAALPLVAHVLRGLWDAQAHADGHVTIAEYQALGGVSGALSRGADAVMAALDHEQLARAKVLLLRLVKLDASSHDTRRSLAYAEALALAGGDEHGRRLLVLLSGGAGARLLVIRGEGEDQRVDLVHEALLREWATLREWIEADRTQLARDEALARRAASWVGQGRPWRSLPRGRERRELLCGRPHGDEARAQRGYQRAMRRAAWARVGGWVGFAGVLLLVGLWVVERIEAVEQSSQEEIAKKDSQLRVAEIDVERAQNNSEQSERESERFKLARELQLQRTQARGREVLETLVSSVDFESEPDRAQFQGLLQEAVSSTIVGELAHTRGSPGSVRALAGHPNGKSVLVARTSGPLERWDLESHELTTWLEGETPIRNLRFSPVDGELLAYERSSEIWLIDGTTGEPLDRHFPGTAAEFSPPGELLAIRSNRNSQHFLSVYDLRDDSLEWQFSRPKENKIEAFTFIPSTPWLASASNTPNAPIHLWSLTTGERADIDSPHTRIRELAASPDGRYLASTGDDDQTYTWTLDPPNQVAKISAESENNTQHFVSILRDGRTLVTNADTGKIRVADIETGATLYEVASSHQRGGQLISGSPDGRWLLVVDPGGGATLREPRKSEIVAHVAPEVEVAALTFLATATSNQFVLVSATGTMSLWSIDSNTSWRVPGLHPQGVWAVDIAPTPPPRVSSASSDGQVRSWTVGATETAPLELGHSDGVSTLSWSADGRDFVTLSRTGLVRRWSSPDLRKRSELAGACSSGLATTAEDAPRAAVVCNDGSIQIIDLDTAAILDRIDPSQRAWALALSADGRLLAVGADGGLIELIEVDGDRARRTLSAGGDVRALAFAADASILVSGDNNETVLIWNVDSSSSRPRPVPHLVGNIKALAISRDASLIAFAGSQPTITLCELGPDSHECSSLTGHSGTVNALAFSADGGLLASGSSDRSVRVWPISVQAQLELARHRLAPFTPTD